MRVRFPRFVATATLLVLTAVLAAACEEGDALDLEPTPGGGATTKTPAPGTPGAGTPAATPAAEGTPAAGRAEIREGLAVRLELVADGLNAPVLATASPGGGPLFVVEQTGAVRVVGEDGQRRGEPFLDLTDRLVELREGYDERGLLGLAFHPDYADNGRFFVYYSAPLQDGAPGGFDHTARVSEFRVSEADPMRADAESERVVLEVHQPQPNHNGGHIAFGPDGFLYVPLGDGGAANDVGEGHTAEIGNGQDTTNLLGSILRIDVDAEGDEGRAYGIPDDNPFADGEGDARPEIWAYGFRNPYDISFDPDGEWGLLVADAGQARFEEVSIAEAGNNYGWHIKEGTHCFSPESPETPPEDCPDEGPDGEPLVDPVVEYDRNEFGTVIVGAQLYRGEAVRELRGLLVFAEWNVGEGVGGGLFAAQPSEGEALWDFVPLRLLMPGAEQPARGTGAFITGLGRDADGELYVVTNAESAPVAGAGAVYRVVSADDAGSAAAPGGGTPTASEAARR